VLQYAALPLYDKPLGNEQRSAEAGGDGKVGSSSCRRSVKSSTPAQKTV
jgi:hypothetical protein